MSKIAIKSEELVKCEMCGQKIQKGEYIDKFQKSGIKFPSGKFYTIEKYGHSICIDKAGQSVRKIEL